MAGLLCCLVKGTLVDGWLGGFVLGLPGVFGSWLAGWRIAGWLVGWLAGGWGALGIFWDYLGGLGALGLTL